VHYPRGAKLGAWRLGPTKPIAFYSLCKRLRQPVAVDLNSGAGTPETLGQTRVCEDLTRGEAIGSMAVWLLQRITLLPISPPDRSGFRVVPESASGLIKGAFSLAAAVMRTWGEQVPERIWGARGSSGVGAAGESLGVDVLRVKCRGTLLLAVQKNH